MGQAASDEWDTLLTLLPDGWRAQARLQGAIVRARGPLAKPALLLRLLLLHAASDGGLRTTVDDAERTGLCSVTDMALHKRLRSSGEWLAWIAARLCTTLRATLAPMAGYRPRALDSTTLQPPGARGTHWRLHYTLDLLSLQCDWHQLTDAHGSELLERTSVRAGDVLLADRNFLRPAGVRHVCGQRAHVLVRLRWTHPKMVNAHGEPVRALDYVRKLRVGEVGQWPAWLVDPERPGRPWSGRIVAVKLTKPAALRAMRKATKQASKKGKQVDARSLRAAQYVMLWTTLPSDPFDAATILAWFRFRWQVEVAFKRLKQLLRVGHLPHKDEEAARGWVGAKLVLALLVEKIYRATRDISPWGYELPTPHRPEPVAVGKAVCSCPA